MTRALVTHPPAAAAHAGADLLERAQAEAQGRPLPPAARQQADGGGRGPRAVGARAAPGRLVHAHAARARGPAASTCVETWSGRRVSRSARPRRRRAAIEVRSPARLRRARAQAQHRPRRVLRRGPVGDRRPDRRSAGWPPARSAGSIRSRRRIAPFVAPVSRATDPAVAEHARRGARRNIAAHYDLGNRPVRALPGPRDDDVLLGRSSSTTDQSLEEAQLARLERICDRLELVGDDHLLEIGTGWGGMAVYAATRRGCRVTTTTISREQREYAEARVREAGRGGPGDGARLRLPRPHRAATTSSSRWR